MAERLATAEAETSPGKGGPSIGAPAGVGELLLAVPAGVDGLSGRPGPDHGTGPQGDGTDPAGTRWAEVLDALEARLEAWRDALRGLAPFPGSFEWPGDLGVCPARLRGRARLILASQRDIEDEMTARRAALGALLRGIGTTDRQPPVPLFIDQRS